jgi:hypothetical protein
MLRSALLVFVLLTACATPGAVGPAGPVAGGIPNHFTSEDELATLRKRAPPKIPVAGARTDVDTWTFVGPFPTDTAPRPLDTSTPWARALVEHPQGHTPSAALQCVARELSAFLAAHGEPPGVLLQDTLRARCGWSSSVDERWLAVEGSPLDEATLFSHWQPKLDAYLAEVPRSAQVGLAFAHTPKRTVAVLISGTLQAEFEPVTLVAVGDRVVLRGRAHAGVAFIMGDVNQGSTKTASCRSTGRALPPAFELECPVDPSDVSTWVSLRQYEEGRLLGSVFANFLVWPHAAPPLTWARPHHARHPTTTGAELVTELNEVRTAAGLEPVVDSPSQRDENRELVPWFLDARMRQDHATEGRLALGVTAGWRVEVEVSSGDFLTMDRARVDSADLLDQLLESPAHRALLMNPATAIVAAGLDEQSGTVGLVLTGYERPPSIAWPDSTAISMMQLDALRRERGLPKVKWVQLPDGLESRLATLVRNGDLTWLQALQQLLDGSRQVWTQALDGRVLPMLRDDVAWPAELVTREQLELVGFLGQQREPGAPWLRTVMFIVTPAPP